MARSCSYHGSGRGEYVPVPPTIREGRAANRRTRIVILPQLDQFFKLLGKEISIFIKCLRGRPACRAASPFFFVAGIILSGNLRYVSSAKGIKSISSQSL